MKTVKTMQTLKGAGPAVGLAGLMIAAVVLGGCRSTPARTAAVDPARDAEMLGGIAALEGDWTTIDPTSGEEVVASVFRPTAAGSAVHEVMFPGSDHEMVNVYHMDGPDLVVTHYCAAGNQPRMVATAPEMDATGARVYRFAFDSVTNYRPEHGHYMGGLVLTIAGDEVRARWTSLDDTGEPTEPMEFTMRRSMR